jgi:hypothetical protein
MWCEARRTERLEAEKRPPLWVNIHERALEPLHAERRKIGERQRKLIEARLAIRERWVAGELDETAANAELAQLRPAIDKTYSDLRKLEQRYVRTTERVLRGRGKKPHSRVISLAPRRPWGLEKEILEEAAAHFSREWSRKISERAVRSAWDDLRSILR